MLTNSILFVILLIICFGCIICAKKWFGEAGLYAWIAIATIVSNITAASIGPMFGLSGVTLANVPFATVFLATHVLDTYYGFESGKKGVYVGLFSAITFIALMMCCSYLVPEDYDSVTAPIKQLFTFGSYNMCNTVASVTTFFLANLANVYLFNKLQKKFESANLEVCSTISSVICNCIENFVFVVLGLYVLPNVVFNIFPNSGIAVTDLIPFKDCIIVAVTTCIFEFVTSLCNAPTLKLLQKLEK